MESNRIENAAIVDASKGQHRTKFLADVPSCSTVKQFKAWKEMARTFPPSPKIGFCEDCLLGYQRKMVAEGRCENPAILFFRDQHQIIYGAFKAGSRQIQNPSWRADSGPEIERWMRVFDEEVTTPDGK